MSGTRHRLPRRLPSAALTVFVLWPSAARATAGTAFAESSRAASMAGAVSARPGDAGTMLLSPGGLADVDEPEVMIGAQLSRLELWMQRTGEPREERNRWMGGFSLAAATPLPGALRPLRLGIAVHFPAEHALRVEVNERADRPISPIYDGRPDRMSALGAMAYEVAPRVGIGVGVVMAPSLSTPTEVSYDADRGDTVEEDVIVRLDRDLSMDVSPFLGVRVQPWEKLGLAVVYRAASVSRAGGKQRTEAGGIVADDPIDYYQFWDPAQLVLGAAAGPWSDLSVSLDLTYAHWAAFRSGFNRSVAPAFENTLSPQVGLEWRAKKALAVRAGYGFERSPIAEQYAASNYLGADMHVLSAGAGYDLRQTTRAPLRIDAHVRGRLSAKQSATKRDSALADADPDLPGQQIDNLGYPGFESASRFYQVGVSVTFYVGKEQKP